MIGPEQISAPDFTEPVVGYRTFRLTKRSQHNYGLYSPHTKTPWLAPDAKAACTVMPKVPDGIVLPAPLKPHPAPAKDCGCGIYAYFNPCPVSKHSYDRWGYAMDPGEEVTALVTLTGRIEVHKTGMRAQRAQVCALGLNANLSADERAGLAAIAKQWDVPLVPQDQLPSLASEYGRVLGEEHRPSSALAPAPADEDQLAIDALSSDPIFLAGVHAGMDARPKRYVVPLRWAVAQGVCAVANTGLLVVWHKPWSLAAALVSSVLAGWNAGRRKEARA